MLKCHLTLKLLFIKKKELIQLNRAPLPMTFYYNLPPISITLDNHFGTTLLYNTINKYIKLLDTSIDTIQQSLKHKLRQSFD